MQSVSSRIWTRVAMSISYDNNHSTTGTASDCLMSYPGYLLGGSVLPSAEMQLVYSIAPADWADSLFSWEIKQFIKCNQECIGCFWKIDIIF